MKVFISYATEDFETAKKLRDDIEKAGIKTWLDKEDLLPGQYWKTVIIKEIKESSHFIALLSLKAFSKGGFVQKELKTALDCIDHLPAGQIFLSPPVLTNAYRLMKNWRIFTGLICFHLMKKG